LHPIKQKLSHPFHGIVYFCSLSSFIYLFLFFTLKKQNPLHANQKHQNPESGSEDSDTLSDGSWCIHSHQNQNPNINHSKKKKEKKTIFCLPLSKIILGFVYFILRIKSMKGVVVLFLSLLSCCLVASANVVLIGNNVTMAFNDIEANFGEFFFNILFMFVLVFSC